MRLRLFKYGTIAVAWAAMALLVQTPLSGQDKIHAAQLALQGRVNDAHGAPISGASVSLAQNGDFDPAETADVKTDSNGKFIFPTSKPGTYLLRVRKNGFNEVVQTLALPFVQQKSWEVVLTPLPLTPGGLLTPCSSA